MADDNDDWMETEQTEGKSTNEATIGKESNNSIESIKSIPKLPVPSIPSVLSNLRGGHSNKGKQYYLTNNLN